MKKIFLFISIFILILCLITGCSDKKNIATVNLTVRVYELHQTNDPIYPYVTLMGDDEFLFYDSAYSSNIAKGTYEIDGDNLVLKTSDGENNYVFKIENDTLVFNKEKSSPTVDDAIKDGAVFVLKQE